MKFNKFNIDYEWTAKKETTILSIVSRNISQNHTLANVGGENSIQWYKKYDDIKLCRCQSYDDLKNIAVSKIRLSQKILLMSKIWLSKKYKYSRNMNFVKNKNSYSDLFYQTLNIKFKNNILFTINWFRKYLEVLYEFRNRL